MAEGGNESRDVTTENPAYEPDIEYDTNAVSSNLTTDASFDLGRPPSAGLAAMELTHSSDIDSVDEILKKNDK